MRVIVAGGGLAGLSAATVLAEAGHAVVVVERERYWGGRAGAWDDTLADGTRFQMERGFHAFFRQYHSLRALLRRVDPALSSLRPQPDYPVMSEGGAVQSFRDLPKRTPFNIATLAWRTPTIRASDLWRIRLKPTLAMMAYGEHTWAKWDDVSAAAYLDGLGFPVEARRMLFDVFSHSFFNAAVDFSAAELLMQFHFYFLGNPEGLLFDTLRRPFSTSFLDPLAAYLRDLGVEMRSDAEVQAVALGRDPIEVVVEGERERCDALVIALSVPGLRALMSTSPSLRGLIGPGERALQVADPFAVWRLWLDRKVDPNRAAFVGTVGVGLLDNISVYESLEDESAAWATKHGGSVIELHGYAVPPGIDEQSIRKDLLAGLHALYPETRQANVLHERFLLRQDCPAFRPGTQRWRPPVETTDRRVKLAGDFVAMPFPCALMERACASGFAAANSLCGATRQPLKHGPERGPLAALRL